MTDTPIRHVLAVGAHPDDLEISCAGTLARYARQGVRVTMLTVLNGDKGSFDLPRQELAAIREAECRAAAAVIGADWIGLGILDGTAMWDMDLHLRLIQALQRVDPDLIITHAPNDYMSDHVETSRAVTHAGFYTVCPQFAAENGKPSERVVPVFFMETQCGVGFNPDEYVDITETLDTKLEMLARHESQLRYLSEREAVDPQELVRTTARFRGLQCGVGYAESFRRYTVWSRLSSRRLLP